MAGFRRLRGAAVALLAVVTGTVLVAAPLLGSPPPARADEATKVLLLLDVSGSMNEKISSGGTKFAAAKRALKQVAGALPAGTQVGLRVYGSRIAEPKAQNPKACTDTELVLPIGPLDQATMDRAVDSFTAKGETPIAYSLGKSVDDLGGSGKRVLILISDGQETCDGDPCPVAKKLAKTGVDLQFNAIGLAVNSKARSQLQCIAKAGDGNYYDADNTDDLTDALRKLTQRALRPLQISGIAIEGTVDQAGAPEITAGGSGVGQYKDRYDASGTPRYYRITRTPGSTVTASIVSIVRPYAGQNSETWTMRLATPDGTVCASATPAADSFRAVIPLGGSVSSGQVSSGGEAPPAACASAPQLLLSLGRRSPAGNDDEVAVGLRVAEEPAVTNLGSLPGPVTGYDGTADAVRADGSKDAVLGGSSFANATTVQPGTWTDRPALGETVFYGVSLQPGQRVRATVRAPAPGGSAQLGPAEAATMRVLVYSPAQTPLNRQNAALQGTNVATATIASPQVRVRNRETPAPTSYLDSSVASADVAGTYYVAVSLEPLQAYLAGRVVPVRVSLAVDGQPTGLPAYATTPTPTPDPSSPAASPPTGTPGASTPATGPPSGSGIGVPLVLVAIAVVVLGGAGLTAALLRRRRRPPVGG